MEFQPPLEKVSTTLWRRKCGALNISAWGSNVLWRRCPYGDTLPRGEKNGRLNMGDRYPLEIVNLRTCPYREPLPYGKGNVDL